MALVSPQSLLEELTHQVNSPLAAIRNALYLAGCRTDDRALQAYLQIADEEVSAIVRALCAARESAGERHTQRSSRTAEPTARRPTARSAAVGHITGITDLACS